MTRGGQRERDREKAAAAQQKVKTKLTGDPQKRKEQDAKALADKIAQKKQKQLVLLVPKRRNLLKK
ncbi:hypothetical protein BCR39DRAFT_372672 [Naematelia encephala]|uniref:Small EDRK-rich factor-like N-terminal domain-containing protein n=1 Tax=Naematelia encephala TaxID=71784 RepID=A0A1Y2AJK0_9TREE|nr:hypothetical protein BCR39DRAFT_372672 [Naematelia encephala]